VLIIVWQLPCFLPFMFAMCFLLGIEPEGSVKTIDEVYRRSLSVISWCAERFLPVLLSIWISVYVLSFFDLHREQSFSAR